VKYLANEIYENFCNDPWFCVEILLVDSLILALSVFWSWVYLFHTFIDSFEGNVSLSFRVSSDDDLRNKTLFVVFCWHKNRDTGHIELYILAAITSSEIYYFPNDYRIHEELLSASSLKRRILSCLVSLEEQMWISFSFLSGMNIITWWISWRIVNWKSWSRGSSNFWKVLLYGQTLDEIVLQPTAQSMINHLLTRVWDWFRDWT
jgi:hypothetical protein